MRNFNPQIPEVLKLQRAQTYKTTKPHLGQRNQTLKIKEQEKLLKAVKLGIYCEHRETDRKMMAVFS